MNSKSDAGSAKSAALVLLEDLVAGRSIDRPPDEQEFAALACAHGLSGLLVDAASRGRVVLSPGIHEEIVKDWSACRVWSAALDLETQRLLAHLGTLRPPILLKGPAMARRYQNPDLRTYVDVDLLVPRGEIQDWRALLTKIGFRGPEECRERRQRLYTHHIEYRRSGRGRDVLVELHTCVFFERDARRMDYEALRSFAQPGEWKGCLELEAPAQLLVMAAHWVKHSPLQRRLIWFRDFIELGSPESVALSRELAAVMRVGWALEEVLAEMDKALGFPRWNARPTAPPRFGVRSVSRLEASALARSLAVAADLGWRDRGRFLALLLTPRRFRSKDGNEVFSTWFLRNAKALLSSTTWKAVLNRTNRTSERQ